MLGQGWLIMDTPIATIKVAGTLQKSGQVMKMVNQLARLPEISQAMQQISMEMTKVRKDEKHGRTCIIDHHHHRLASWMK